MISAPATSKKLFVNFRKLRRIASIASILPGVAAAFVVYHKVLDMWPDGTILVPATTVWLGTDYAILGGKGIPALRELPQDVAAQMQEHGTYLSRDGHVSVAAFRIDQFPVSVHQFKAFVQDHQGMSMPEPPDWNPGWSDEDMPMVNVSPTTAAEYAVWDHGSLPTYPQMIAAAFTNDSEFTTGAIFDSKKVVCSVDGARAAPIELHSSENKKYKNEKGIFFPEGEVLLYTSELSKDSSDRQVVFGGSFRDHIAGDFRRGVRQTVSTWEGHDDVGFRVAHPLKESD